MVCTLKLESDLGQKARHLIAKIGEVITGGDREITALQRNFISQIPAFFGASCVPVGLVGVKGVEGRLRAHLVTHIVEDEELCLCTDVTSVGDAGGAQVGLCLCGNLSGVA